MKRKLHEWRWLPVLGILAFVLSGCGIASLSSLRPAGEVAQTQYELMILSTIIMVLVVIVVTILFLIVLFRFRRKKGDETIPKQVEGNHKLEITWTVIPIILLIILSIPTVKATFHLDDTDAMEQKGKDGKRDALVINVRANLYWWEFEYPDLGIITSQDLVVPTDEKVYFNIKASDVKHSFWVPAVGGKMDANTEGDNQLYLVFDSKKADEANDLFYGKCAELCGPSHGLMDFKVVTKSKDEFNAWVKDMKMVKQPAVVGSTAKQGEAIFNQSCIGCHAVTPNDGRPEAARTAPNLATFGERQQIAGVLDHTEENLKKWIKSPETYKPGNTMTGTYGNLSDKEIDALAAYLMQLRVEQK